MLGLICSALFHTECTARHHLQLLLCLDIYRPQVATRPASVAVMLSDYDTHCTANCHCWCSAAPLPLAISPHGEPPGQCGLPLLEDVQHWNYLHHAKQAECFRHVTSASLCCVICQLQWHVLYMYCIRTLSSWLGMLSSCTATTIIMQTAALAATSG